MGLVDPKSRGAVLVVDDDEDLRAMLRETLECERYFVLEADDGKDALEILRVAGAGVVRLIILDLVMPSMSGWELIEILRRDPMLSGIPVLVTTGMPVHGDASGIGATMSWLRKPFGEKALLAAVGEAMSGASCLDADEPGAPRLGSRPSPPHHDR
jgi:CheY-like chemotaxis protein